MDGRDRVIREIVRSAASSGGLAEALVHVRTARRDDGAWDAFAEGGGVELSASATTEDDALWALLDIAMDAANAGRVPHRPVMTPGLQKAMRLLKLSRLQLIEEIRRELEQQAEQDDVTRK